MNETQKKLEMDKALVENITTGIKTGHMATPNDVLAYLEGWLSADNGVDIGRCTRNAENEYSRLTATLNSQSNRQ